MTCTNMGRNLTVDSRRAGGAGEEEKSALRAPADGFFSVNRRGRDGRCLEALSDLFRKIFVFTLFIYFKKIKTK